MAALHGDAGDVAAASPSPPHTTTTQILFQRLSPYPKHLAVAHINSQSLRGHIDEIREVFQPLNFDIICVTESWLKPSIQSKEVAIPGYVLLRNDRTNKIGGGVGAYIRECFNYKLHFSSPSEYSARREFIFIEISLTITDNLLF